MVWRRRKTTPDLTAEEEEEEEKLISEVMQADTVEKFDQLNNRLKDENFRSSVLRKFPANQTDHGQEL